MLSSSWSIDIYVILGGRKFGGVVAMAKEYDEILLRIPKDDPILELLDEKRGDLSREDFILTVVHIVCGFTEENLQSS